MTQLASHGTELQRLLEAADTDPGYDETALSLTFQAAVAAAQVSPELARPYVSRLWFTPWRTGAGPAAAEREARWTANLRRTTYRADGQELAALELGRGPTVLLLHGWGDSAARVCSVAERLVVRGFHVIAPDLPGHGANPPRETDLLECSCVVTDLARTSGARAIVAHSLGGVAAARAATEVELDALVLLAPAVRLENVVTRFRDMFGLPDAAVEALRVDIEARFGARVWADWRVDEFAIPSTTPVLLLHSDDDEQIDVADGRLLARSLPACEYVELSGLGHTKLLRDQSVSDLVVRFVHQNVTRPHGAAQAS